ncbi:MAG: hypothetical protein R3C11_13540 [Planctomycetaceae bacterium]
MRIYSRPGSCLLILLITLTMGFSSAEVQAAKKIPVPKKPHAVKGFHYKLTEEHGPWMIMVAVFSEPPEERRSEDGLSPQQAADELVYELRSKGLPAYTFRPNEAGDKIEAVQRDKRDQFALQNGFKHLVDETSVCVLAGNFDIMSSEKEEAKAERTLEKVKGFVPMFLDEETQLEVSAPLNPNLSSNDPKKYGVFQKLKNGAVFAKTPGKPKPLSGAFLTVNPLRSPEELSESKRNKYLADLNSGGEYSLLDNPAKYTLIVATFYGNSKTEALSSKGVFEGRNANQELGTSLDDAARKAWEFCKALRTASDYGYDQNYEAYVLHTRYKSYVTIGSFERPDDPKIEELKQLMGAKIHQVSAGGASTFAEVFSIPRNPGVGQTPQKSWMFDPEPQLSQIPKIK